MVNSPPPGGAFSRGLHLGKLGLSLTSSYLGYQLQKMFLNEQDEPARRKRFQQKASRSVREELQALKGPVMKLGQMLSMQGCFLPPEALEELAGLQMQAPAMHPTLARAQFKASMGRYPEAVYREFEPEPMAAASLGQVHRAVTQQGDPVAVKIQYPAIRKAVQNDFKLLRSASLAGRLSGHFPKTLVDELEARILLETDYLQEGKNLDFFRKSLRPLAYLEIPRVYWELTTDRVLTMSRVEGGPLNAWLAGHPTQAQRDLLGARLFELFFFQVFRVRALHADPHPGNYLFTPEGAIKLVDFGCTKEVTPQVLEIFHYFLDERLRPADERVDWVLKMLWGPEITRKSPQARKLMAAMMEYTHTIFPTGDSGKTLVDFGNRQVLTGMARLAEEILRGKLMVPDLIFYKRAEIGLYNYLHQLGARVDVPAILRRVRTNPGEAAKS